MNTLLNKSSHCNRQSVHLENVIHRGGQWMNTLLNKRVLTATVSLYTWKTLYIEVDSG